MKLKINGTTFTVEYYSEPSKDKEGVTGVDLQENNNCGLTFRSRGKVFINEDIAKDQLMTTIIHELVHVYAWCYGFTQIKWEEENVCDFISVYGEQIINDSKKVLKYLTR